MKVRNQLVCNGAQRWVVWLCVLVIGVFGFVQAVHVHDGLLKESLPKTTTHCLICAASHLTAVAAEISFAPVLSHQPGAVLLAEPQLESHLVIFNSFIRPPPPVA